MSDNFAQYCELIANPHNIDTRTNVHIVAERTTMWIEEKQTAGGVKYRYYERYQEPLTGKIKKACITLDSNSRPAQKQAIQLLQEKVAQLTSRQPQDFTFSTVAAEWLEHNKPALKPTTIRHTQYILKRLKELLPPDILLSKLNVAIMQDVLNTIYNVNGRSFDYSQKFLTTTRLIFKYAKRMRYIHDISFLDDVEIRRKPKTIEQVERSRNKFLDKNELKDVLSRLSKIHARIALAMEFISLTGLRFGELVALRPQDYDKENKEIYVNGSISRITLTADSFHRGTPKNIHSIRTVSLDERADKIINWFMLDNRKKAAWSKTYKERGYIFTSSYGNPMVNQLVNNALHEIKYHKPLTTHVFRHTHISLLTELGVPIKSIMQRVGHNNPKTTLSIYTHVTNSMELEVVQKLNALK